MANLKEIRTRITSVESTMQITSAMKMVSAAKFKRAQDAIVQMRPFAKKFNDILLNVSSTVGETEHPMMRDDKGKKVLLIAISLFVSSALEILEKRKIKKINIKKFFIIVNFKTVHSPYTFFKKFLRVKRMGYFSH